MMLIISKITHIIVTPLVILKMINGSYLYNLSPITWSDPVLNNMASDGGSGLIGGGTITADLSFTLNSNDVGYWPNNENITINFPLIVYSSDGGATWTGRIPCCDQYGLGYLYNVTPYTNLPYSFGSVTQVTYAYNSFTCLVNNINDPFNLVSYIHSGHPASVRCPGARERLRNFADSGS